MIPEQWFIGNNYYWNYLSYLILCNLFCLFAEVYNSVWSIFHFNKVIPIWFSRSSFQLHVPIWFSRSSFQLHFFVYASVKPVFVYPHNSLRLLNGAKQLVYISGFNRVPVIFMMTCFILFFLYLTWLSQTQKGFIKSNQLEI